MITTTIKMPEKIPGQYQDRQPGIGSKMEPRPLYDSDEPGYNRLEGKVAIITGGDSGIGRSVAIQVSGLPGGCIYYRTGFASQWRLYC